MGSESKMWRYATTDPEIVDAIKAWWEEHTRWGKAAQKLGRRHGRKPIQTQGLNGIALVGFDLKKGESTHAQAWKDTPWMVQNGRNGLSYLRPRANSKEGQQVYKELNALGRLSHPCDRLKGIPKNWGFLSTPGILVSTDKTTVIASYGEPVRHDDRWSQIKESSYWTMIEAAQTKEEA